MTDNTAIRDTRPADLAAFPALYADAFADEDLLPLVRALMRDPATVLSLTATTDDAIAGHVLFAFCTLEGGGEAVALLGPLAVASAHQRRGVGGALIRAGLQRMKPAGTGLVCVLGDPAFYERFGFAPEPDIAPPYPLPPQWRSAWQSTRPGGGSDPLTGRLAVPAPWRDPALWAP